MNIKLFLYALVAFNAGLLIVKFGGVLKLPQVQAIGASVCAIASLGIIAW